ncbi:MAG TPA: hypothetical protein VL172_04245 [Kofleriaceae bacterium]|nr:hypothetical protein [Kofleriaceae bacterium]
MPLMCAACAEPEVPVGGGAAGEQALVVDIPPVRGSALDLLFVIDNTENMTSRQVALRASFERLLAHLAYVPGGMPDLHVGIVSTDLGTGSPTWSVPGCSVDGDAGTLRSLPLDPGCAAPADAYLSDARDGDGRLTNYAQADLASAFQCLSVLGAGGCAYQQPLEAMRRALDGSLAANDGFVRPEATLGVVILTDQDDCSVSDPEFFDPDLDSDGVLSKFRCFERGVYCGGDDVRVEGKFDDCVANEQSDYLHGVHEYARFLDQAKLDPDQVVVAGLIGTSSLVEVEVTVDDRPQVVPACTDSTGTPTYPAIRLQDFLHQARQDSEVASLCSDDGHPLDALEATARRIRKALGTACLDGDLVDVDADAAGLQFDCTIWDKYPDGELVELPECSQPYDPADSEVVPCYAIKTGPEACGDFRPHQLALQVWRGAWDAGQPDGVHTVGQCLVNPP